MIASGTADRRPVAQAPGFGYDGPGARTLGRRKETRPTMMLGMTLETFTRLHVVISLIGIASGLMAVFGMISGVRRDGWTTLFLWTTVLTSVTGFGFPVEHLLPSHKVGIISLIVLAVGFRGRSRAHRGPWRWFLLSGSGPGPLLCRLVVLVPRLPQCPTPAAVRP